MADESAAPLGATTIDEPWTPIAAPPVKRAKPPGWSVRRLSQSAAEIHLEPTPPEMWFQHSALCQTSLPYRRLKDRTYERQNGRIAIRIEAGAAYSRTTDEWIELPVPSGPIARLFLIHLDTEALRTKSPDIELGDNMTAFAQQLLRRSLNGRELQHFREEAAAVAGALFRFAVHGRQLDMKIVSHCEFWYPKHGAQRILWPSMVRLVPEYHVDLQRHAVPLDPRAVVAMAHNALALDVYKWLAQRLFHVNKPTLIPWPGLHQQFGQGYGRLRDFRDNFNKVLASVLLQYDAAQVTTSFRGLTLRPSRPPIAPKVFALTP